MPSPLNLLGEPMNVGLRKIGAIKEIDDGPHGRFAISIVCDALPLRKKINEGTGEVELPIMLIDERKLHWTPFVQRERQTEGHDVPVYGQAKCLHCDSTVQPVWNVRGKMFECPRCSSVSLKRMFSPRWEPKAVSRVHHRVHHNKAHA